MPEPPPPASSASSGRESSQEILAPPLARRPLAAWQRQQCGPRHDEHPRACHRRSQLDHGPARRTADDHRGLPWLSATDKW